jgi:hypothetical protein
MIKLSMNNNRRDAIAMLPLTDYTDNDPNFINNADYLELRNALRKTLQEMGPLVLATAAQAQSLVQVCDGIADGAYENMQYDSSGTYRLKYLTHKRIVDAIIRESKKAGWKLAGGLGGVITIEEDK